jgi:hypothetical protein
MEQLEGAREAVVGQERSLTKVRFEVARET